VIQSIDIENFQAHGKQSLWLSKTITTIKGPTDAGKSAILRALRWVCLNDLGGDEFIKEGETETTVTLNADGEEIVRRKSVATRGINTYTLDDAVFKSFSGGVPDPIKELLSVSSLNFQSQHDSPFWFSETAGEVSRQLKSIIDLTIIDQTLSTVGSALRTAQERVNLTTERAEAAETRLQELLPLEKRIAQFETLKEAHDRLKKTRTACGNLDRILTDLNSAHTDAERWAGRHTAARDVYAVARNVVGLSARADSLQNLLERITRAHARAVPPPSFANVALLYEKVKDLEKEKKDLEKVLAGIAEAKEVATFTGENLSTAEERFHRLTKGKECPLCQNLM
jgi:exonuclease SbcC